jgi:thioredoxin reductase
MAYDVAVIGAGVFGAWTARHLRRAGASALLVDAWGSGHSRACSGGESRNADSRRNENTPSITSGCPITPPLTTPLKKPIPKILAQNRAARL